MRARRGSRCSTGPTPAWPGSSSPPDRTARSPARPRHRPRWLGPRSRTARPRPRRASRIGRRRSRRRCTMCRVARSRCCRCRPRHGDRSDVVTGARGAFGARSLDRQPAARRHQPDEDRRADDGAWIALGLDHDGPADLEDGTGFGPGGERRIEPGNAAFLGQRRRRQRGHEQGGRQGRGKQGARK